MIFKLLPVFLFILAQNLSTVDPVLPCPQVPHGPGSSDYLHDSVVFHDFASEPDGYWLMESAAPRPDSARVVVFVHGYGAYNPMIYGKWMRHLVQRGNIVIFPRYQKNLVFPLPEAFIPNVATAVQDAYEWLEREGKISPIKNQMHMVGHSFGGAITANMNADWKYEKIPAPKSIFLVSPGTGPWRSYWLHSYETIPSSLKMLIMVSDDDHVVGDGFANRVFATATATPQRNLIRQYADEYGSTTIHAGHNECGARDAAFDGGIHGHSWRRSELHKLDPVDYNGYWKLFDALMDCADHGVYCTTAFGNTPQQRSLGYWNDGTPIRPLEVILP